MAIEKTGVGSRRTKPPIRKLKDPLEMLRNRTLEQIEEDRKRIFAKSRPAQPLPPGKTREDVVVGTLHSNESEKEIWVALAEL